MSRAWYQLALAPASAGSGIPVVAAQGDHLGEALAVAAKAHPQRAVMAARLSPGAPLGDAVGKSRNLIDQGLSTELPPVPFRWPAGVIPEFAGLERLVGATPGYVVQRQGELLIVEVQLPAEALGEAFLGWIERLPVADNLEVRVLHHFEEQETTEVWLTPRIGVKPMLRFLDAHDRELIDNGYVELGVYLRQERSTLRLTEHKTLLWTSMDPDSEARVVATVEALGARPVSSLVAVSAGPHFHVRARGTKDRAKLTRYLSRQRLRRVDQLDRQGASLRGAESG